MSDHDPAPSYENADEWTKGLTEGTFAITTAWEQTKRAYNEDPVKVYEAMDIFFLAIMVRLSGGSIESVNETVLNSFSASDILNNRK